MLLPVKKNWTTGKKIIFFCLTLLAGALIYVLADIFILTPPDPGPPSIAKGDGSLLSKIPWMEIGLYFMMLLGMASKYFYDAIGDKKWKRLHFNKYQFIKPFLASPIIFLGAYSLIPEKTSAFLLLFFAFQNGFFWQTLLYKKETAPPPDRNRS